ncbi:MAG: SGNH/GDSL hydrolase family protein [Clostridia bacterium]|nr:SGNH/GDSL hydrolase family protein [Clostridia bacterium]
MTRILCYGDSNTYGYNPMGGRYGEDIRWPMVMQRELGENFRVIEEGLNGRTFCCDDPLEGGFKSGLTYLPPCLMSHNPIDLFAVMLGTNDTKERFGLNSETIAFNLSNYVRVVREYACDSNGHPPRILIISPPLIGDISSSPFSRHFGSACVEKAGGLSKHYQRHARLHGCDFLDAGLYTAPGRIDAVHLSANGHISLGKAVATKIREIFNQED